MPLVTEREEWKESKCPAHEREEGIAGSEGPDVPETSEQLSADEAELASSLLELQDTSASETSPAGAGRPKRSKRKRFDSTDYIFEDDLQAGTEVADKLYAPHTSVLTDALMSAAAVSSLQRASEESIYMRKRPRKTQQGSPTPSVTSKPPSTQRKRATRKVCSSTANASKDSTTRRTSSQLSIFSVVEMCPGCGASSTPAWRTGSAGTTTLCNACGSRVNRCKRKVQRSTATLE
ncbi:hypothetical protein WJX74_008191 [Apatococcus lobatus]|uniref:GATA-type domain-containing protein n=1 Tax=Apatococcus lobatus TaxID=904363 RepID=A0AAW1S055_9CHLO